jgi:hypothetical protein
MAKHLMTKDEYMEKALKLAAKCKVFAEETCQQWRIEVSGNKIPYEATDWEDLRELREVYLTLETLKAKSDSLCRRAMILRRLQFNWRASA